MKTQPIYELKYDHLRTWVFRENAQLGQAAAETAADYLTGAIRRNGEANLILATGNSQLTFLRAMRNMPVQWSKINVFHLDEYIGLDPAHPASFPLFLRKHLLDHVHPKRFFPLQPGSPAEAENICRVYEKLLAEYPADLCVMGIGENGHLAFNDPAYADFEDSRKVKIVQLEETSRRQQVGEGHFKNLDEVPTHAVTLTIPALLAARQILVLVPEARKAEAVYRTLTGPIEAACPASILRRVPEAYLFLDKDSAREVLPVEYHG
jgi:glucosamine-6-phosphate deaminase